MKTISSFTLLFLIITFITLSFPNISYSQPQNVCCEFESVMECEETSPQNCTQQGGIILAGDCDQDFGACVVTDIESTNVPTLSQWGLIATAGLLGIIGFIVIRRRQLITNS